MIRLYEEIVGRGGMSPDHFFYRMTFGECAAFIRGRDIQEQAEWERTRRIMWAAIMPHGKRNKTIDVRDVLKFPWDVSPSSGELDEEELKRVRNLAKKIKL